MINLGELVPDSIESSPLFLTISAVTYNLSSLVF